MYMFGHPTLHVMYVTLHTIYDTLHSIYDTLRVIGAHACSTTHKHDALHTIYKHILYSY